MKTDLELETPQKVYIVVDITQDQPLQTDSKIIFDEVVMDSTGSWNKRRSRFVAPWVGKFKFCKINFRCRNSQSRDFQARVDDSQSDTFKLLDDNDPGKMNCREHVEHKIDKKDDFVSFYRHLSPVTLKCSKSKPCRLVIQS